MQTAAGIKPVMNEIKNALRLSVDTPKIRGAVPVKRVSDKSAKIKAEVMTRGLFFKNLKLKLSPRESESAPKTALAIRVTKAFEDASDIFPEKSEPFEESVTASPVRKERIRGRTNIL